MILPHHLAQLQPLLGAAWSLAVDQRAGSVSYRVAWTDADGRTHAVAASTPGELVARVRLAVRSP